MHSKTLQARALLVGQGLQLRRLQSFRLLARDPFTIALGGDGIGVLFRFGVVVLFGVGRDTEATFLDGLREYTVAPDPGTEAEVLTLRIGAQGEERIEDGALVLADRDLPRLQVVADVLAKSELLDTYEQKLATTFDRIEPLAEQIQVRGRLPRQAHSLMAHIGEILQIQHRMVGRAQLGEKPEILWDHPEQERLWQRLENEYEIGERQVALERKLDLISSTAQTLLELLQARRSLRVEWYIVILIVVEILLTLYEMFFRHA